MADLSWLTREFIADQRRDLPIALTPADCQGKTYIVTGANIGLGKGLAEWLVRLGSARVIMAVRNTASGENAKREIEKATGKKGVASVWELDLGKWESVKAFAKRANEELDRIDSLIENAAIGLERWTWAEDHETCIKVNALSTMLLGVLLLPKMIDTGKRFGTVPHLVFVGSNAAWLVKNEFAKVQDGSVLKGLDTQGKTNMDLRYPLSKLIQMLAVFRFARLFPPSRTGVVINLLSPGLVKSGISRHGKFVTRAFMGTLNFLFARTPEMAARSIIHAMQLGEEGHGAYVSDCKIKSHEVPDWIGGPEGEKTQDKLWDEIAQELEKAAPGCLEKLP
ncbi:putative secondary metabolism biosynthetic enzyme [Diatrype stigma]|uniref:Secondary metabolism biosynthetic enzyme n=1 Tax=Diatrype stigma TaxID=117547 RepID=A0AAN9YWD6_9PEZI